MTNFENKIIFEKNDKLNDIQTFVYDVPQELYDISSIPFERYGYDFAGWSETSDFYEEIISSDLGDIFDEETSDNIFIDDNDNDNEEVISSYEDYEKYLSATPEVKFTNREVVSNLTSVDFDYENLYTKWKSKHYVIQFNPGNGAGGVYYQSAYYNDPIKEFLLKPNDYLVISSNPETNISTYISCSHFTLKDHYLDSWVADANMLSSTDDIDENSSFEVDDLILQNFLSTFDGDAVYNLYAVFLDETPFTFQQIEEEGGNEDEDEKRDAGDIDELSGNDDTDIDELSGNNDGDIDDTNSKCEITSYSTWGLSLSAIVLSSTYYQNDFLKIRDGALSGNINLVSFTFDTPTKIEKIGNNAFLSCALSSIYNVPRKIEFGEGSFKDCKNLKIFNFVENSENNEENSFDISVFNKNIFKNCSSLSSIIIPEGVSSIQESAFENCSSLTNIEIPSSVTSIGDNAFAGCSKLMTVKISKDSLLETIGKGCFKDCRLLNDINLLTATSLLSANDNAFENCISLRHISFPKSINYIGKDIFKQSFALLDIGINASYDEMSAVFNKYSTWNTYAELKENKNADNINFSSLSELNISSNSVVSLTEFGKTLNEINIPSEVTSISPSAFYNATNLQSIVIPADSQLTSVGNSAFENCYYIKVLYFPKTIKSLGNNICKNCLNLNTVIIDTSSNLNFSNKFNNTQSDNLAIYFAGMYSGKIFDYTKTNNSVIINGLNSFGKTLNSLDIPNTIDNLPVVEIKEEAFLNNNNLKSLTISALQLKQIGRSAFNGCKNINSVIIPDSVEYINDLAFFNCENLSSVTFSNNSKLAFIGICAFARSKIKEMIIPINMTKINSFTFESCESLNSVRFLAEEIEYIDDFTFNGCKQLKYIFLNDIKDMSNYCHWGVPI